MAEPKNTRRRSANRKGRFAVPAFDIVLASKSAKKRAGAHVVGRKLTDYLLLPDGAVKKYLLVPSAGAKVDAIADRLASTATALEKRQLRDTLRRAVLSAHEAGVRKIIEFNASDRYMGATAAGRALRALSELVNDPTFIPAIRHAAPIAAEENQIFGDHVRELADGLEYVTLLEAAVNDVRRRLKPIKRQNPGLPYLAAFAERLVAFWRVLTGELPSKARKQAKRTKSKRVLFWRFLDYAMSDLALHDQPIDYQVRIAIDRAQKGERLPPK